MKTTVTLQYEQVKKIIDLFNFFYDKSVDQNYSLLSRAQFEDKASAAAQILEIMSGGKGRYQC